MDIALLYATPIQFHDDSLEQGIGGNENILINGSRVLAAAGHKVTVYAELTDRRVDAGVAWTPLANWPTASAHEVTVAFRSPHLLHQAPAESIRTVLLGDRRCPGLAEALAAGVVDAVFASSVFQYQAVSRRENLAPDARWHIVPFSVQLDDYQDVPISKHPGQCLYASAPYRGLDTLLTLWPRIKSQVPHATLAITASYLLWGESEAKNRARNRALYAKIEAMHDLDVTNHVKLARKDFVHLQKQSELLLYPSSYEEAFCLTVAEACAAGAVPITSTKGALPERIRDHQTGLLIPGNTAVPAFQDRFVGSAVAMLTDHAKRRQMSAIARTIAQGYTFRDMTSAWVTIWEQLKQMKPWVAT